MLDNNPDDMEGHQEFLNRTPETNKSRDLRSTNSIRKSTSQLVMSKVVLDKRKSREYELDKEKLKTSIRSFLSIIQQNNRDILKI